jgi:hypothetical protein
MKQTKIMKSARLAPDLIKRANRIIAKGRRYTFSSYLEVALEARVESDEWSAENERAKAKGGA